MTTTVRTYTPNDYNQVMAVWQATHMGGAHRGDNADVINRTLANGGALFVLEDTDAKQIVGTAWITNDSRRLYLHHFGITPEYQGKRLSYQLMEKCMEYARSLKMQIKLEVHQENLIAQHLYEQYGFGYLGDYKVLIVRNI